MLICYRSYTVSAFFSLRIAGRDHGRDITMKSLLQRKRRRPLFRLSFLRGWWGLLLPALFFLVAFESLTAPKLIHSVLSSPTNKATFLPLTLPQTHNDTLRTISRSSEAPDPSNNLCGCPLGNYLSAPDRQRRTELLKAWCTWLTATQGFVTSHESTDNRGQRLVYSSEKRTWWNYEHPQWPKPSHCTSEQSVASQQWPHLFCTPQRPPFASFRDGVAIFHPSKTGSTTIRQYIKAQDKGRTHQLVACDAQPKLPYDYVALSVRPPLERLVSGIGELLKRKCTVGVWQSQETQQRCWDQYHLNATLDDETTDDNLAQFFACILRTHECAPAYCWAEHLYTHAYFVSPATNDGPYIDTLLPTHNLTEGLPALFRSRQQHETQNRTTIQYLPVSSTARTNAGSQKDERIQHQLRVLQDLLSTTTNNHTATSNHDRYGLLESVCRMFMQDFICFEEWMETPDVCRRLLQKAAKWWNATQRARGRDDRENE